MNSINILEQLIAIDTTNPPGNERRAALYLRELLSLYGFRCEIQELGKGRANLIASMGENPGPVLIMNGHLDVVPVTGGWATDPFQPVSDGDWLYGRGTADMKGGIAAMCEAAIRVAKAGGPGKGCLKLLFVADEECSNLGTVNYLKQYEAGDYVVIGEPTDLQVAIAHRGVCRDYIDIMGTARHAALSGDAESSVEKTADAILAVREMNRKLGNMEHEVLPPPGIAVTMLEAYEKDNIVPARARMLLDFRILPGMDRHSVHEFLRHGFAAGGLNHYEITGHFYMPGGELSVHNPFVQLCLAERETLLGEVSRPQAFEASCEQCFFVEHGAAAVICGPGNIAQAHTVDEFTSKEQVQLAADLYERMINRVLAGAGI